jgi:large subunit ribosomal protein L6
MSRVGNRPIAILAGVEVKLDGALLSAKGPKGSLAFTVPAGFQAKVDRGLLTLAPSGAGEDLDSLHGLYRSLIANMIQGVSQGYAKALEIQGVGFKAAVQGKKIIFSLGFSKPKEIAIPEGVDVKVTENVNLIVSGPDKQVVGNLAAGIKALFPAEPYKGKGIRFKGEHVRRKVGKTVA